MKRTLYLLPILTALVACAASEPSPPKDPSSQAGQGAASKQPEDNANRALTKAECESLGEYLVDVCKNRPNSRSSKIDGWCSDTVSTVGTGSWVTDDCVKHIKYFDSVCFRSTTSISALMDCDSTVAR
jgi:hypothetical protein